MAADAPAGRRLPGPGLHRSAGQWGRRRPPQRSTDGRRHARHCPGAPSLWHDGVPSDPDHRHARADADRHRGGSLDRRAATASSACTWKGRSSVRGVRVSTGPIGSRNRDAGDLEELCELAGAGRSLVTLAPECVPAGFVRTLAAAGVRISIGHSEASAAVVMQAVADGATGVTHLFNAMPPLSARAPGIIGAALAEHRLTAGLIVDGIHVDPVSVRAAFMAKGADRIALVTDAMPTVGTSLDRFELAGRTIKLADGRLTAEEGTLGGRASGYGLGGAQCGQAGAAPPGGRAARRFADPRAISRPGQRARSAGSGRSCRSRCFDSRT